MARFVLLLLLFSLLARIFWRSVDAFIEAAGGRPRSGRGSERVPQHGASMVRDPVCGTFVLPDHAVTLMDGRSRRFFCSEACRDKFRARTA
jgi:YHS domain-containing protein